MDHKLGIILSGGGVKGAAHIGVLKAMEEYGINATCIAGTSAGALAGAFYADGFSHGEILDLFRESDLFSMGNFSFTKPGLLDSENFVGFFENHLHSDSFESLKKKLYVVATDLVNAKSQAFHSGPLIKPLLASCAFPMIFSPVQIADSLYSDGGIINNFPVETIADQCEYVLGVYVSPLKKIGIKDLGNTFSVMDRVYRISNRYASLEKFDQCNWVINPPELENYGTFALNKVEEVFEIGYRYGLEMMPEILERIS